MQSSTTSGSYFNNGPVEKPEDVYIHGIPGLRTLGIFGVILYHMYPYTIKGGFLGVCMFFLIAGYLLAVRTGETRKFDSFNVLEFYLKRVKRLYPQLLIVLFVTCGVLVYILPEKLSGIKPELSSIILSYNNIWQISQNASYFERIANSSPFTHMWSLSNEFQVYIIWPLIFFFFIFLTRRLGTKSAITMIGVFALLSAVLMPLMYRPDVDVTRIYYGTDTRLFSFLTGAYIGFKRVRYRRNVRIKNTLPYNILFTVLTAAVIVSYILMDGESAITYRGGMFAINLLMAWMLGLVTDNRLSIGQLLEKKVFVFFGNISYEMYLWMYPVIYIFHVMGFNKIPASGILILIIIIVLAQWLHSFTTVLVKRKIDFKGDTAQKARKLVFAAISVFMVFLFGFGAVNAATAPSADNSDMVALQKELEENAKKLSQQTEAMEEKEEEKEPEAEDEEAVDESQEEDVTEEAEGEVEEEADPQTEEEGAPEPEASTANGEGITFVGDSVMLGASPALMEALPGCVVDAAESRQATKALEILKSLKSQGKLKDTVVIALGTNGPFKESVGQDIVDFLGPGKTIYWIDVYGKTLQWMDESNSRINGVAAKNSNVTVIEWSKVAPNHADWFYNDGIHLKPAGQTGYAEFVKGIVAK